MESNVWFWLSVVGNLCLEDIHRKSTLHGPSLNFTVTSLSCCQTLSQTFCLGNCLAFRLEKECNVKMSIFVILDNQNNVPYLVCTF